MILFFRYISGTRWYGSSPWSYRVCLPLRSLNTYGPSYSLKNLFSVLSILLPAGFAFSKILSPTSKCWSLWVRLNRYILFMFWQLIRRFVHSSLTSSGTGEFCFSGFLMNSLQNRSGFPPPSSSVGVKLVISLQLSFIAFSRNMWYVLRPYVVLVVAVYT